MDRQRKGIGYESIMSSDEQFPVFLQQSSNDCGPSCLYIISQHYELGIDYNSIKSFCDFTIKGVNFQSLLDAAARMGLEALPIKIDISMLKAIPLPAILLWNNNHYVVLYKVINNQYYVSNPMYGLADFAEERLMLSACDQLGAVYVLLVSPANNVLN